MELHKEIASWLYKFKLVPKTIPALSSDAKIEDLLTVIRDGVVLCQLLHSLDPGCIDMTRVIFESIDGRSVSDFVCRNNIFLFLHAMVSNFNVPMEHFFQPEDLYLCQNLGKVFQVLSVLSHSPNILKSGVSGFPKKEKHLMQRVCEEQSNYEALCQLYGNAETEYVYESFAPFKGQSSANNYCSEQYEDIYRKIIPPKAPRIPLGVGGSLVKKKKKRHAPVKELVDTEDKFLGNLIMVRDRFREPMTAMSANDKRTVFFCLDELIILHSDLLFELKQKKSDIGLGFLKHISRITSLYGSYCVNLPTAMGRLEQLANLNQALKKQLADCLAESNQTFPLSSHLVVPFQRFLKYHLLLKEILKYTDDDAYGGSHYVNLTKAVEDMLAACEGVNEKKREYEELDRQNMVDLADMKLIQNVASTIKLMKMENGLNLLDYGRLRKAGEIASFRGKNCAAAIGDYVFLFDMMIVLCHKPKWLQHRYRFREAIKVKDHYLEPPNPNSSLAIRLYSRVDPRQVFLVLVAKSQQDKDMWFSALVTAMDAVSPGENESQGHVIQLATFADSTECFQCQKKLRGKFYQGYRCLRCQAVLHKGCLATCSCLEVGSLKKSDSVCLPTAISEGPSVTRSASTLSLAPEDPDGSRPVRSRQPSWNDNYELEMEKMPVDEQSWFAGDLSAKVATERLEALPVGTFLVRRRANGSLALMLKSPEVPKGVKSMKIEVTDVEPVQYFLSHARKFDSIQKLIAFYRSRDLTENFNYESLKGVSLKVPYKDV